MKKLRLIIVFLLVSYVAAGQQSVQTKSGVAVIPGDFADPSVVLVDGVYYAVGTSSEWAPHFPIFKSTDLLKWKQIGYAFDNKPAWTSSSFWAPELFYNNGKFLLYYVARRAKDNVSCIGLAETDDPAKGFSDLGVILETGKEAIDPFVFRDGRKLHISWKAYGLDKRPIELLSAGLSDDGRRVQGTPVTLLRDDERKGMEGQSIIKRGKYYYLFFSAGNCCGLACSYHVNVVRAENINGPYTKAASNPVLKDDENWKCPGHGTLVKSKDGFYYYLYHAYSKTDDVFTGRQGLLSKVSWEDDWPVFGTVNGELDDKSWKDDFASKELSPVWQWDFRNSIPTIEIDDGELCLSGSDKTPNASGTILGLRPHHGNYVVTAGVTNTSAALKGIAVYGDAGESVGIGISGDTVQLWNVHQNQRIFLNKQRVSLTGPFSVRIVSEESSRFRFYWSGDGVKWIEIKGPDNFVDGRSLPQWDRSPRIGLHFKGKEGDKACFSEFNIRYE